MFSVHHLFNAFFGI